MSWVMDHLLVWIFLGLAIYNYVRYRMVLSAYERKVGWTGNPFEWDKDGKRK